MLPQDPEPARRRRRGGAAREAVYPTEAARGEARTEVPGPPQADGCVLGPEQVAPAVGQGFPARALSSGYGSGVISVVDEAVSVRRAAPGGG